MATTPALKLGHLDKRLFRVSRYFLYPFVGLLVFVVVVLVFVDVLVVITMII